MFAKKMKDFGCNKSRIYIRPNLLLHIPSLSNS